jgi:hypothetical protein
MGRADTLIGSNAWLVPQGGSVHKQAVLMCVCVVEPNSCEMGCRDGTCSETGGQAGLSMYFSVGLPYSVQTALHVPIVSIFGVHPRQRGVSSRHQAPEPPPES